MSDWPPVAALPTKEMELLGKVTLAAPAASFSFTSIDPAFLTFEIVAWLLRDANAAYAAVRLNNDSGANYLWQSMNSNTTVGALTASNDTAATYLRLSDFQPAASSISSHHVILSKPAAGTRAQGMAISSGFSTDVQSSQMGFDWNNTADLISRIDIISVTNNFAAGSRVALGGGRAV